MTGFVMYASSLRRPTSLFVAIIAITNLSWAIISA